MVRPGIVAALWIVRHLVILDIRPRSDDEVFDLTLALLDPEISVLAPPTSPRVSHDLEKKKKNKLIFKICT